MRINLTLSQKGRILVLIPLLSEIIFVTLLWNTLAQAEKEVERDNHSRQVLAATNKLVQQIYTVMTAEKGDISPLIRARQIRENFVMMHRGLTNIEEMVKDSPTKMAKLRSIENRYMEAMQMLRTMGEKMLQNPDTGSYWVRHTMNDINEFIEPMTAQLTSFVEEEVRASDDSPRIQAQYRERVRNIVLFGLLFNVMLALTLLSFFNRNTSKRMGALVDNTLRLAANKPLNKRSEGNDEIALVDGVFHTMAHQLAEARRKERAIIENAVDVICTMDATGRLTEASPAATKTWGYEELVGMSIMNIVLPEDTKLTREALERVTSNREDATASFENRIKCQDGSIVDMAWSLSWSSEEKTIFCVARDISARKRIDRMKEDFVAMVSHDLRTPLSSLQAVVENLEAGVYGELNQSGLKILERADGNVKRMIGLINDLLDVERMESGTLELDIASTSVSQLCERCMQSVAAFAAQQDVALEVKSVEATFLADEDRLVQVLVNLVGNAVKFTPAQGKVTISNEVHADYIEFRVSDTGRGIPRDKIDSIFEKFQQVQASDATKKKGSGLGLAICKAIVECHAGQIGVTSELGKGSTFWLRIPSTPQTVPVQDSQSA